MKRLFFVIAVFVSVAAGAQEFNRIPVAWKWTADSEVLFTYDGSFADADAFAVNARTGEKKTGVTAPEKYPDFPVCPEGAVNLTYSPDSTMLAFTRSNDLYVVDIASGKETRLTFDGTDLILNGYASWVYYEEIFGRASKYRAFWWSPDSRKIGFYRFDNTQVPIFPIYSAFAGGIGGSVSETRYPKCGQTNPQVRIGIIDLDDPSSCHSDERFSCHSEERSDVRIRWADFDPKADQYFGIPFWSPDSREFFISRMPRLQNTIDLYAINVEDGSKRHVYNETYKTWLNWMDQVVFTEKGLYMARDFETGWQQIYYLSYDGKEFRRLTDGTNWSVTVLRVDEKNGEVYFTAKRDASVRKALYKVDNKGNVTALTDPAYNVGGVCFSPDGRYFAASYSNLSTPVRVAVFQTSGGGIGSKGHGGDIESGNLRPAVMQKLKPGRYGVKGLVVADMKGLDYSPDAYSLGILQHMTTPDGFTLPAIIQYPEDFDPTRKYPVHVDIYGGPDTPMVNDRWVSPTEKNQWYSKNGIIQITVDPRAGGHNGRKGLDMIYRQLTVCEVKDFCSWADWLKSLPYVDGDKIGVEGFSFGGTMTAILLMQAPDRFHYGIAGGGVYDWALYDSHYTERYMDTPQNNPEGYEVSKVLNYVDGYPSSVGPVMLKLTHGTGDDNVHHQNTLLLIDALQKAGKTFELMIYPDGMHGYRDYQGEHFLNANREFWLKYLH